MLEGPRAQMCISLLPPAIVTLIPLFVPFRVSTLGSPRFTLLDEPWNAFTAYRNVTGFLLVSFRDFGALPKQRAAGRRWTLLR